MGVCSWCNKEMRDDTTVTCLANTIVEYPDGVTMPSLADHFAEASGRCHDCLVVHGGKHHPGCDVEKCPRCRGQLISCGCLRKDDEDDDGSGDE